MSKEIIKPRKFIVEYFDTDKRVTDRWHYNLDKFPNGPILTENLDLPKKEKEPVKSK